MHTSFHTLLLAGLMGLVATTAAAEVAPESGKHYSIYLLAGQSNMDGRGAANDLKGDLADYAKPLERVLIRYSCGGHKRHLKTSNGFVPLKPGYTERGNVLFGPEIGFGHALSAARPDENIILVKVTEGGTNLHTDWNPETENGLYHRLVEVVKTTEAELEKAGAKYELAGMLWHQGESDSDPENAEQYGDRLKKMFERLRNDIAAPEMPVLIGSICVDNKNYQTVIQQSKEHARTSPSMHFVSAEGLTTSDKNVHFDSLSQIELGKRFAKGMLEASTKK